MKTYLPQRLAHLAGSSDSVLLPPAHGELPEDAWPRLWFSQALLRELVGPAPRAAFRLVLGDERAARALLDELARARFAGWSGAVEAPGTLTFQIDFSPDPGGGDALGLSVIIPSRDNPTGEIERALDSVRRALPAGRGEVLVIDDGSRVPVEDRLAGWRARNPEVALRVARHERPLGVARARNHGVKLARNRRVAFLDADDEFHPHYLAAMALQFARGAEVVGSDMLIPVDDELVIGRTRGAAEVFHQNSFGSGIGLYLDGPVLGRLFRHQPLYNPLFWLCYEDWELNGVLWLSGAAVTVLPAPFYVYHRRPAGRDGSARRYHAFWKRLLPLSARARVLLGAASTVR